MVVDLFLVYQFIRRLATPFNKWEAFETGVIDDKGNILVKKKDRTSAQKKSFKVFDVMVRNMKRLLAKLPGGSTRLASYAAALFLIKEHKAFTPESLITEDMDEDDLEKSLELFYEGYLNYTTLDERVNCFLSEKLKKSDDMGTWIKDFYDSDAPQFKGKSKAKRRQMAVAAKLDAMDEEIHPAVIKAYKNSRNAEHRDGEYGTTATKRAVTRTANTLSKKIKQHHPDLDMQGKIKLRTQLQNMKEDGPCWDTHKQVGMKKKGNKMVPNCVPKNESELDELSLSLKDLSKTGLNKKAFGDKDKLKKDLERLRKGLKKEDLDEARKPAPVRWKRAGANGEIQATIGGKKYQIEKALDHNERHKGEWKVMVWDQRRESWEWETTEYGKSNAKAWIMDRMNEEPANNVGSGNIAGMDGGHMSKAAQKKWTSSNKSKKKKLRDIMGDKI